MSKGLAVKRVLGVLWLVILIVSALGLNIWWTVNLVAGFIDHIRAPQIDSHAVAWDVVKFMFRGLVAVVSIYGGFGIWLVTSYLGDALWLKIARLFRKNEESGRSTTSI